MLSYNVYNMKQQQHHNMMVLHYGNYQTPATPSSSAPTSYTNYNDNNYINVNNISGGIPDLVACDNISHSSNGSTFQLANSVAATSATKETIPTTTTAISSTSTGAQAIIPKPAQDDKKELKL